MAMQKRTVRELAKGEFFRLMESDTAPVRLLRGERLVWVGFTF